MMTDEMRAERLTLITGTDASIICGASKYCTPYELWEYKTGRKVQEDISDKPAVKAGTMLEPSVMWWLAQDLKLDIRSPLIKEPMFIHPDYPWMAGNIDGRVYNEDAIIEIKTTSNSADWGVSGGDVVPVAVRLQCTHYMAVTGAQRCYVAVLIRGVDFRYYILEKDVELEAYIIAREKEFYDCMVNDIAPSQDSSRDLPPVLIAKPAIIADDSIRDLIASYKQDYHFIETCKETLAEKREKICKYMGASEHLTDGNGNVVVRWTHRKGSTGIDIVKLKKYYPDICRQVAKEGKPTRVFKVEGLE